MKPPWTHPTKTVAPSIWSGESRTSRRTRGAAGSRLPSWAWGIGHTACDRANKFIVCEYKLTGYLYCSAGWLRRDGLIRSGCRLSAGRSVWGSILGLLPMSLVHGDAESAVTIPTCKRCLSSDWYEPKEG
jgi:hypothetical protein